MSEMWKPVVGREGEYEVSDQGRVRSLSRMKTYERRDQYSGRTLTVTRAQKGRMLRPGATSTGHLTVSLGRGQSVLVHRLVLEAFVGPCPPKPFEALHADDVPSNNRLTNLSWGTRSRNIHDAIRNGGRGVGERSWQAKLTNKSVADIRASRAGAAALGRRYGVSESTIRQVRNGRAWRHPEFAQ